MKKKTLSKPVSHALKLSDEQFFSILRENAGLFSMTAKAIEKQFGIKYTRQSVRERALGNKKEYEEILERNLDIAEAGLVTLMQDENPQVKLRAIEFYLKTQGKRRGYVERTEIEGVKTEFKVSIKNAKDV
jgi:hypothetical protein